MIGIIGGTGLYQLGRAGVKEELDMDTPFGKPSAHIKRVTLKNKDYIFLPRHGENHQYLPHEVNYAANIYALKKLGVSQIISISAVGSLAEKFRPGDFVIIKQYIDSTKGLRRHSFFGQGLVGHVSTADPTCSRLSAAIFERARHFNMNIHKEATYVCIEGPRLGTRAESLHFQSMSADIVGMTNVPEAFLAREAQICYSSIGVVTDYDCWKTGEAANTQEILDRYNQSLQLINSFLNSQLNELPANNCSCRQSLKTALLSDPRKLPYEKSEIIEVLQK